MESKITRYADFVVAATLSDSDNADLIASARTDLGDFLTLRAVARDLAILIEPELVAVENELENEIHDLLHEEL
jgi:hypothetical protein